MKQLFKRDVLQATITIAVYNCRSVATEWTERL